MPLGTDISSWHVQDLNWEDPNPLDARYMQAICNGLIEGKQKILASHGLYDYPDGIIPAVLSKPYYENGDTGLLFSQSDMSAIYAQAVSLFSYFACTNADGVANSMRLTFSYSTLGGSSIDQMTGGEDYRTVHTDGYGTTISFRLSTVGGLWEARYRGRNNPWSTDPTTSVSRHIMSFDMPVIKYEKYGNLGHVWNFDVEPWTEKTMMDYIGAEKIEAACSPINAGAWMKQMYKIINALTVYGTGISNSSSFNMSYAEEKYANRYFAPTGPYSPAIWRGDWGYNPSGSLQAPPDIPPIETLWGYGGFQVWNMSTAHYFAAAKRRQNSAEDSYGNPEAGIDDLADRYRSTATISLSCSGILAGASIDFHAEPLKLSKESYSGWHYVNGEYVEYDIAEFNDELGAENSLLVFEKSGISGISEAFSVGNIDTPPVAGTLVQADRNGSSYNSYKNWVIYSDYQFYKDNEFGTERNWTKATANVSQAWNFKAD